MAKHWRDVLKDDIEKYGEPGMALRGFRYREGYTQQGLSKLVREEGYPLTVGKIREIECRKARISAELAEILAKILRCDKRHFEK